MSRAANSPGEIPLHIDRAAEAPLPVQLAAELRAVIHRGLLRPGERVPATRDVARRLGVARGVAVAAYEQLIAEGYLTASFGRGTEVNAELARLKPEPETASASASASATGPASAPLPALASAEEVADANLDAELSAESPALGAGVLAPGKPITDVVDRPAWRTAWRKAAQHAHRVSPPLGDPRLRVEIADHLRQMRGTSRSADDVIVTAGSRDGLALLLTTLSPDTPSRRPLVVGVEDPGYPSLRSVAERYGATIVALPVDDDGLRTANLPHDLLDIVIVTPSHQYPTGGSLPLTRRRELLAWAHASGVIVVEDDYDSELRHVGSPLPALAALDTAADGVVVTLGTFSSTITPALAAGFMLAPRSIRERLEPARRDLGSPVSTVVQLALAEYLSSGELKHNVARVRRLYASRRDRLSERLAGIPGVRMRPMSGGLHAVIELGQGAAARSREHAVITSTDAAGIGASSLDRYWQRDGSPQRERPRPESPQHALPHDSGETPSQTPSHAPVAAGIVIGMGGPDEAEFGAALETLRRILIP